MNLATLLQFKPVQLVFQKYGQKVFNITPAGCPWLRSATLLSRNAGFDLTQKRPLAPHTLSSKLNFSSRKLALPLYKPTQTFIQRQWRFYSTYRKAPRHTPDPLPIPPPPPKKKKWWKKILFTGQSKKLRFLWWGGGIVTMISLSVAFYLRNRRVIPYSGRIQFSPIPTSFEKHLANLIEPKVDAALLPEDHAASKFVTKVGERLVKAGGFDDMYDWKFYVVQSDDVNAFSSLGGRVFVCTGILPLLETGDHEQMLAALLGHEIGHCVARHQMENALQLAAVASVLNTFLIPIPSFLLELLYSVAVFLPYSRQHEHEADIIGMYLMADACYHPQNALALEKALKDAANSGANDNELLKLLSTHPPSDERIKKLELHYPSALTTFQSKHCYQSTASRIWSLLTGKK